jgi:hypothetical protein
MLKYLTTSLDGIYLVWMESCNQFIQLAEPAFRVFRLYANDTPIKSIVDECVTHYNLPENESFRFVNEMIDGIELQLQQKDNQRIVEKKYPDADFSFVPHSVKYYAVGDKCLKVSFENRLLEHYIHPLFCHLESEPIDISSKYTFELFYYQGLVTFRHNGQCVGQWPEDASAFIKGKFFIYFLNDIYNKTESDWMATLHASAVINGKKAIAFSASSGSGKSTLAAIMHANGYQLIADDFVAVDKISKCAHPFPVAMSVKDGSLDVLSEFYPSLKQGDSIPLSHNRSGKYLTHEMALETYQTPLPVTDMIFVEYNPQVEFDLKPIKATEALQLIVDESWIQAESDSICEFMQWLAQTHFYRMRYSVNSKAIEAVKKIFEE